MNYIELHLGDYEAATAHLTALEDGIYSRLLRLYYRTEKPLPADMKQVCRLARAQSKPERDAVQQVLADFFELQDDGWHQTRCDEEIARYQAGEPEREVKKANEDNRLKRFREERAALFKIVTQAGEHLPWNVAMSDLRAAATRISNAENVSGKPLPATAPATPATATQTPDTRHQAPDTSTQYNLLPSVVGGGAAQSAAPAPPPPAFDGNNAEALNGKAVVPIASTWELPEQWGIDAEALGWKQSEILREAEKFRQYWVSGKGNGKRRSVKGWRQTWSNWLEKAAGDRR